MILNTIKHRDILGLVLNEMGLIRSMAEIGVRRGDFSKSVLSAWEGRQYHCIDPWAVQDAQIYREQQDTQERYDDHYAAVLAVATHDTRINLMRCYSTDAALRFGDEELDCVYIDGNHSYSAVLDDMNAWWPKVRLGGILGGHDFENNTENGNWIEVEKAVIRWARERGKVFYVSPCGSWWIHKTSP